MHHPNEFSSLCFSFREATGKFARTTAGPLSTIRRARIKASASHLASLAGKRRGGDIQKKKDDEISTKVPDKLEEINEIACI